MLLNFDHEPVSIGTPDLHGMAYHRQFYPFSTPLRFESDIHNRADDLNHLAMDAIAIRSHP
jgi:hypothetical protein